ncbi:DNA-directed RNA polymerase III subunit RPC5 [Allomyces javanicus]|nr:DNA-directed RNA polymerase III subunit RPC5 [Allomyces javanicus]
MDIDMDIDADPIVKEIPVFLSSQLARNLHLYQFPIRSKPFPAHAQPNASRIKVKAALVELDVPLDTSATHYDANKGEEFGAASEQARTIYDARPAAAAAAATPAFGGGDAFAAQGNVNGPKPLESMTLASTVVPHMTKYYAAAFRDDGEGLELHMSPIVSTLQFTPKLKYLDDMHEREKEARKRVDEEEKKARGETVEKKSAISALPRVETEEMMAARKKSVTYLKKEQEQEPYVKIQHFHEHTPESGAVFLRFYATHKPAIRTTGKPYLDDIAPQSEGDVITVESALTKPGAVSREHLKTYDLDTQVKVLMMNSQILPLADISRTLHTPVNVLLPALMKVAVPVHGTWIVRSDLVYTGREAVARNYLIHMFATAPTYPPTVLRKEFADMARLDVERTARLLSDLAEKVVPTAPPRPGEGTGITWRLKYTDKLPPSDADPAYSDFASSALVASMQELGFKMDGTMAAAAAAPAAGAPSAVAAPPSSAASLVALAQPTMAMSASAAGAAGPDALDQAITAILDVTVEGVGVVRIEDMHARLAHTCPGFTEAERRVRLDARCHVLHGGYVLKARETKYPTIRQIVLEVFANASEPALLKNKIVGPIKDRTGKLPSIKAFNEMTGEFCTWVGEKQPYVWKTYDRPA